MTGVPAFAESTQRLVGAYSFETDKGIVVRKLPIIGFIGAKPTTLDSLLFAPEGKLVRVYQNEALWDELMKPNAVDAQYDDKLVEGMQKAYDKIFIHLAPIYDRAEITQ